MRPGRSKGIKEGASIIMVVGLKLRGSIKDKLGIQLDNEVRYQVLEQLCYELEEQLCWQLYYRLFIQLAKEVDKNG